MNILSFCTGDEVARICKEAQQHERELWLSKVKVSDLTFHVSGFDHAGEHEKKSSQIDRTHDILKDKPNRIVLKHIRKLKSYKGKDYSYKTTPLTILSTEPYIDSYRLKNLLTRESHNGQNYDPLATVKGRVKSATATAETKMSLPPIRS